MDPHFLLAHVNLADVYNYERKYTEAEKHALEALGVEVLERLSRHVEIPAASAIAVYLRAKVFE